MKKTIKLVSGMVAAAAFALVFGANVTVNSSSDSLADVSVDGLKIESAQAEDEPDDTWYGCWYNPDNLDGCDTGGIYMCLGEC